MTEMHCMKCGITGKTKRVVKGSFIVELGLWVFFGFATLITLGLAMPLLLIPLIYSIWRLAGAYQGCGNCRNREVIPAESWERSEMTRRLML